MSWQRWVGTLGCPRQGAGWRNISFEGRAQEQTGWEDGLRVDSEGESSAFKVRQSWPVLVTCTPFSRLALRFCCSNPTHHPGRVHHPQWNNLTSLYRHVWVQIQPSTSLCCSKPWLLCKLGNVGYLSASGCL